MRTNSDNLSEFKGLPVKDWPGQAKPAEFGKVVFRLRLEYDEAGEEVSLPSKLSSLLDSPGSDQIQSLVIGAWNPEDSQAEPTEMLEALVSSRDRLPNLRNLFLGDIMSEENEISWIQQGDLSPLLAAFGQLEHLTVRGGSNLTFGTLRHDGLKELVVQTGGLPPSVIHEIAAARLPSLEHLELWLGEPNYGGDATVEDLAPLLRGDAFPKLRYLGLKDSVIQDEIAGVVALAPILDRLEVLDLSMGTLGDEGAKALLASPAIRKLKKLDLHYHFISEPVMMELAALGIEVDISDLQKPYVSRGRIPPVHFRKRIDLRALPMRLVLIGNASSRRTALLEAAARRRFAGLALELVPWVDLIAGRADLRRIVQNGDCVRIDSPGKDFEAERLLLRAGAESGDSCGVTPDEATASVEQVERLVEERGRIYWPALWYRGFCRTLDRIGSQLAECGPHRAVSDPAEIQVMFDKTATHARLKLAGVPVVPAIGRIRSYDELVEKMRQNRWQQAFVKLAYGSSASGAVALRLGRSQIAAFTTVEFDGMDSDGQPKLYNTRRIRELRSTSEAAAVVNAVCRHAAHAERWVPKAGMDGKTFDLRVVVIGQRACHMVARRSQGPITNLNLLNERGDFGRVRDRCGQSVWAAAIASCETAMQAFPRSLHAGIDLLIVAGYRRHAVLEVNAFGDLLPGVTWHGMDTYEAELEAS